VALKPHTENLRTAFCHPDWQSIGATEWHSAESGPAVDEILYVWASREATTIDGFVRPTEIEIYAGDDIDSVLEGPLENDDPLGL
jgi:hypothetical protein